MSTTRLQSMRDAPGTAREYETTYVLRPNTPNDAVAEVNTKVKGIIEGMGGKVVKVDNWGKRRLAYEVSKERKGIYLYWLYLAQPGVVEEVERNLRMLDGVLRYLSVKVDENVDVGARPIEVDDAAYERAAATAADEEDMFLTRSGEAEAAEGEDDENDYEYNADDDAAKAAKVDKVDKVDKVEAEAEPDAPVTEEKE